MRKLLFAVCVILTLGILAGCSKTARRNDKASELGRNDAMEFIEVANTRNVDPLKVQGMLLEVRWKERKMKEAGFDKAAENYIEAFTTTLSENDESLYREIFP